MAQNAITNFLDRYFGAGGTRTWDYQQVEDESMPGGWQPTYTSSRRQPQVQAQVQQRGPYSLAGTARDPNAMIYCDGKFVNKAQYRAGACNDKPAQEVTPEEAPKALPPLAQVQRSMGTPRLPTESLIPKRRLPEPEGATRRSLPQTRRLPGPEGATQRRMLPQQSPSLSGLLPFLGRSGPLMAISPSVLAGEQSETGMMGEAMPGFSYVPGMSQQPMFDPTLGGLFSNQSFDSINNILLNQYMEGISPYANVQTINPEEAAGVNIGLPFPVQ
jgi:hypothetical protein